ncbi:MAG TPA: helix-turn-helix transcriptional regulator [Solirubrobacteraceae bacterium]|nr:helix-turn-helix transcriptional regulator [Solirubrobacteraceae bacterium]
MSPDADPHSTWTIRSGEDLGRAIAEIRTRSGLTQRQLAAQTGLSREYLAQIETGRTGSLLEHLLRVLRRSGADVTVSYPGKHGPT